MLRHEKEAWKQGFVRVAGMDEAGRGPLAGPVVAAAVRIPRRVAEREEQGLLAGLTDSKQLTRRRRENFYRLLVSLPGIRMGVGLADAATVDRLNILVATHLAMARALQRLQPPSDFALVDGRPVPGLPCPSLAVVGGDGKSLTIAAASVVAKILRDRMMNGLDAAFPAYGFAMHKGYGTRAHLQALQRWGPCPQHRRSFAPVRRAASPSLQPPGSQHES